MDLWCLMTTLHGSLYAAVNAAAYFNGHDVLVDDYEFLTFKQPHSGIASVNLSKKQQH
jgi:hypothetical protein